MSTILSYSSFSWNLNFHHNLTNLEIEDLETKDENIGNHGYIGGYFGKKYR